MQVGRKLGALALGVLTLVGSATAVVFAPFACGPLDSIRIEIAGAARGNAVRDRVAAELASGTQPAWAGRYGWTNGREHRHFNISGSSFWYEFRPCTGPGELAYGSVSRSDGNRLRLSPSFRGDAHEAQVHAGDRRDFEFSGDMYSVPWGDERFLVPTESMPEFCALTTATDWNSMAYATYPRLLRFDQPSALRTPDLTGLPDVPPEFRRYLPQ